MAKPRRSDARRNRDRLLLAARDVVVERGPNAPLDQIARRAGVGIGTLYRHFPDRAMLLRAVALEALSKTTAAARDAAEDEDDPLRALTRYLREALDLRVSAVIPTVLEAVDLEDPEIRAEREASAHAVEQMIADARTNGSLPPEITFADIGMMLVRIARPLPGPLSAEQNHQLARRHLELFIRALSPPRDGDDSTELPGPSLGFDDIRDARDSP